MGLPPPSLSTTRLSSHQLKLMAPTHSASSQNIMILAVAGMDLLFISFYTIPIVYLTIFVMQNLKSN
jgi:hypothetical protein